MKCLNCYRGHPTAAGSGVKPTFGVEEMEKMIEKAVCLLVLFFFVLGVQDTK